MKDIVSIILTAGLLNFYIPGVAGEVDESNEGAQPNYEYIQIFRSIPALFEYLLDALEERPEILEKNDVTIFQRNFEGAETENSDDADTENIIDKREANYDTNIVQDKHSDFDKVNKRDTSTSTEVPETTVAYEYGNSNVVMKSLDEMESNKVVSKRLTSTDHFNNFVDKKREIQKMKKIINPKEGNVLFKLDEDTTDMFRKYGEVFFGFEHLFGLDLKPEEIEERILTAEKLLEEHNNKKDKK